MRLIKFVLTLLVCAALLVSGAFAVVQLQWVRAMPSFLYEIIIFLFCATLVIFAYLYRIDEPGHFVQLYLLTLVVKILASAAFSLVMIVNDRPGALANVVFLMLVYGFFTALEIAFLFHYKAEKGTR